MVSLGVQKIKHESFASQCNLIISCLPVSCGLFAALVSLDFYMSMYRDAQTFTPTNIDLSTSVDDILPWYHEWDIKLAMYEKVYVFLLSDTSNQSALFISDAMPNHIK